MDGLLGVAGMIIDSCCGSFHSLRSTSKMGFVKKKHVVRQMAVCQNLVPLVNIKIAGKWMFIPLKMVLIGIDPTPNTKPEHRNNSHIWRSLDPDICRVSSLKHVDLSEHCVYLTISGFLY
jgi:hypothetical protein